VSPTIVAEYREVLSRRKFGLSPEGIEILVNDLEAHATMCYPTKSHNVITDDPDDNAIVDCAVEANADYIVSGDGHLTDLQEVGGIRIVTPAAFVELIT
jgi:putative PIN family toxin of toxin-antitoxin system